MEKPNPQPDWLEACWNGKFYDLTLLKRNPNEEDRKDREEDERGDFR